ncbi:hypothetical protein [Vibrio intestinalis]|uniref:hypothetical protein n=1 Tax=Vibrio intestinalis TaxID=2933291 RepID=UPI0021A407D5|nr:hypothetical protein [Vibrio intestinalis]
MDRKLGQVMTQSRMITFIAFLAAIFSWALNMRALLFVSVVALVVAMVVFVKHKLHIGHHHNNEKSA